MVSSGSVREFFPDEGWGVVDSPDVPGGCWVHFSVIEMEGYRALEAGQEVTFDYEHVEQDGYTFRATRLWHGLYGMGETLTHLPL
jgi:CspA family cold shock protein